MEWAGLKQFCWAKGGLLLWSYGNGSGLEWKGVEGQRRPTQIKSGARSLYIADVDGAQFAQLSQGFGRGGKLMSWVDKRLFLSKLLFFSLCGSRHLNALLGRVWPAWLLLWLPWLWPVESFSNKHSHNKVWTKQMSKQFQTHKPKWTN